MIQQDYFIRVIQEFFAALARALEKKEMEGRSKAIQDMYQQYLGSYEFYQNATAEEAIDHIATVELIDRNSDTFSLARAEKIKDIQNRIRQ